MSESKCGNNYIHLLLLTNVKKTQQLQRWILCTDNFYTIEQKPPR